MTKRNKPNGTKYRAQPRVIVTPPVDPLVTEEYDRLRAKAIDAYKRHCTGQLSGSHGEWTMSDDVNKRPNNQSQNSNRRGRRGKSRTTLMGTAAINSMVRTGDNLLQSGRRFLSNRYMGPNAASNIARDLSLLKAVVNTEEKQIFTLATAQNVLSSSSLVYGIGTVAQGSASNQRSGDSIKITRIDLILGFAYGSGTATTEFSQTFNWYLIRYKKTPSSSGTTAFGIAEFLNADGNGNYTPLSFPNPDTNENFQLMGCGTVDIQLPTTTSANGIIRKIVPFSHTCNFHQEYSGSANTTITDNMCFVVLTAINAGNTGGTSTVTVQSAMWYVDN